MAPSNSTKSSPKLLAEWFWTDRWIASSAFGMPLEARGLYREMLTQAWRRGARLPNDPDQVRRMTGVTTGEWRRTWPLVERFWRVDGDALVNETQLEIYTDAVERMRRASERGVKGAQARAQALLKQSLSTAQAHAQVEPKFKPPITGHRSPSPKEQKISAEPSNGSPPVLTFPTVGPSSLWSLSEAQLHEWEGLYPNISVRNEMNHALAWIKANPARRKTAKGMPRFLVAWLTRAVDNGNGHSSHAPAARRTAEQEPAWEPWTCPHVEDHATRWRCEQATALGRARKVSA